MSATYLTVTQARVQTRRMALHARRELAWAVNNTLVLLKEDAVRLSSGPLTASDRRKRDYPYAKRHGPLGKTSAMPGRDPAVINVGRDVFRRHWRNDYAQPGDRQLIGRLANLSDVSEYLNVGTPHAIARPTVKRLEGLVKGHMETRLEIVRRDWRRKYG